MLARRAFLASSGAAALAPRLACAAALQVPKQIKSFCIDFNWRRPRLEGWHNDFARPGHWAGASPEEHVVWYEEAGVNAIQTFCVSCNGYAWYKGGFVPPQPGLVYDFLTDVVRLGHKKKMLVLGYFCAGANTKWGQDHPDLSYGSPSNLHIPYTDEYVDHLCRSIDDAIRLTGIDGYMLDWLWNPAPQVRESGWIASERKLFEKLTGKAFPASGEPDDSALLAYERSALERCWGRVHETTKKARRDCIIFLSCNKLTEPTIANTRVLRETDWVLNEGPDRSYYDSAFQMIGPRTRLLQGLVGWADHNAGSWLVRAKTKALDCYGFAEPRDNSMPLPVSEYLSKPPSAFEGTDFNAANDRNIATLVRLYRGMAPDAVVPKKG